MAVTSPYKGEDILKRFNAANARKSLWIDTLQQAYQYSLPQRENFWENRREGQKKNEEVYDATAILGVQRYASRMQATLMPPWRKWSKYSAGATIPEDEKEEINKQLEKANDILFMHLNHSALATQAHEAFLDCAVSTGALLFQEGQGDKMFDITAVPLNEIVPEEGPDSSIETVWRTYDIPARLIMRKWEDAKISETLRKVIDEKPDTKVELIEGTIYNPDSQMYDYIVMHKKEKEVVVYREEEVTPWIVFRTSVMPGEILGRGPIMQVLPDILTANKVVEFTLRGAAIAIGGIYTSASDGVINPYTLSLVPNTIIPVRSNSNENPSLRRLDTAADVNTSEVILSELRNNIRDALLNDQLGPVEGPTKSATEISIRQQTLVQQSGSTFGRLQTELTEKLIKRATYILQKAGKIPKFKVDGEEVTLRYESPLAQAQDADDIQNIVRWMEYGMALGPETFALGAKIEDIPAAIGEKLAVPQALMRTELERDEIQQNAAMAMQQQQEQPVE